MNKLAVHLGSLEASALSLDMSQNQISDVCPIENFTSLTRLHIKDNPIQNMEPLRKLLEQLPNLELDIPAPMELKISPPANR